MPLDSWDGRQEPDGGQARLPGARILVVDDDKAVLQVFCLALRDNAWHVEGAASAEVALERLRAQPFDLYLIDKNLPGMSGVELIREIRRTDAVARCILVTAYASKRSAVEAGNLGIDAYIEKPCDVIALKDRVRALLEHRTREARAPFRRVFARAGDTAPAAGDEEDLPETPASTDVVVASPHREVRKRIIARLPPTSHTLHFASSEEQILALFARQEIGAAVLHGDEHIVELVSRIRKAAPTCRLIVAFESLELAELKQLIELQVDAMLDIASDAFAQRIEELLQRL
jgi:DNA-binding response OmpR family regulator